MTSSPVTVPFVDLSIQHQPLGSAIKQAMQMVIERGDFILGQAVQTFEKDFASACGVEYGVGVASGTAAIALGLKACGIEAGSEVLIPANTFIATVIGAIEAGATPVLVDCDPQTALIDLSAAQKAITPKTKAILPVHLYGQMVSPVQLFDFARTFNLKIFEDAAQAHLASREGWVAGSVGQAAAFSFYPSKNLGAFGNGGMLVTADTEIASRVRSLRNYGAPSKYYHTELGTNSRLDSLQAAVLEVKLPHLASWNRLRYHAAQYYDKLLQPLADQGITPLNNTGGLGHVYHLYVIRLGDNCSLRREDLQNRLSDRGIQTGIHYPIACHLQPACKFLGYQYGDFPQAERLCQQVLSLPMYPGLSQSQIEQVVEQLSLLI